MGQAAYNAVIKVSDSNATSFLETGDASNASSTDKKTYIYVGHVRANAHWDSKKTINVVYTVNSQLIHLLPSEYTVDYLNRAIKLKNPLGKTVIQVSAYVITTTQLIKATQYSVEIGGELLDDTNFVDAKANKGFRTKMYGLLDVSINVSGLFYANKIFQRKLKTREKVYVEIKPASGSETIKGWFVVESFSGGGDMAALETETISLKLDGIPDPSFTWG